jgi:hypothetical protein
MLEAGLVVIEPGFPVNPEAVIVKVEVPEAAVLVDVRVSVPLTLEFLSGIEKGDPVLKEAVTPAGRADVVNVIEEDPLFAFPEVIVYE